MGKFSVDVFFSFDLEDDAVRCFGLTAEYPATLNQPLKIGGYVRLHA